MRVLAVPREALTSALQLDVTASQAIERIARSILDLGQTREDVCGAWAAETLLPASALARAADMSLANKDTVPPAKNPADTAGEELSTVRSQQRKLVVARTGKRDDKRDICKTPPCLTPDSSEGEDHAASSVCESEDLPSPSRFVRRRRDLRAVCGSSSLIVLM